jgi:methionyl-tRNA synthetase
MKTVLYVLVETIRCVAIMAQPIIPRGSAALLDQLAVSYTKRDFEHVNMHSALKSGTSLPQPQGVFPRLELNKDKARNSCF